MFRTVYPSIIRSSRLYLRQQAYDKRILLSARQQYLFDKCLLLYVQSWTPDDGRKDSPKHVECHSKIKWIWYIGASSWCYYRNNITIHGPMNVKSIVDLNTTEQPADCHVSISNPRALDRCCTATPVPVISIRTMRCCNMQTMSSGVITVRTCPLIPIPTYLAWHRNTGLSPAVARALHTLLPINLILFTPSSFMLVSAWKILSIIKSEIVGISNPRHW